MHLSFAALLALIAPGASVQAANINAPFELEATMMLPAKVRNPRIKMITFGMDERFGGYGVVEPLGAKLNKSISWQDLIDAQATAEEKASVDGVIKKYGLESAGGPGNSSGVVNVAANVTLPALAVGITDNLLLAVAVPVYSIQISQDTGFVRNTAGQSFVNGVCESSSPAKCDEAAGKLNNAIQEKLKRLGYNPLTSRKVSGVGDMRVLAKWRAYDDGRNAIALRPTLTLPTGAKPSANEVLDISTGDGQTDLGLRAIWDHNFSPNFRLNNYVEYTYQFADRIDKRLPISSTDSLSNDIERVSRKLGDQAVLGSSVNFGKLTKGPSLGVGYTLQFAGKASYEGNRFESYRYRLLEDLVPSQTMHSLTFLFGFSTIDWYKAKKFFYPFQALVSYSRPFAGRNVGTNGLWSGELVLFF